MIPLLLLLAATPRISAPDLTTTNTSPELAAFCSDRLSNRLRRAGAEVVSSADIAQVLGLERQRQLLGCSSESSDCMAELSAALGAELMMSGRLARLGQTFELSVRLLDTRTSKTIATAEATASGEEGLGAASDEVGDALAKQLGLEPPSALRPLQWVSFGLAAAAAVTSAISFGLSQERANRLLIGPTMFTDELAARSTANEAVGLRNVAIAMAITTGALAIGGVIVALVRSASSASKPALSWADLAVTWDFL